MLPTTSVNSRAQSNGTLGSRDAARHTAGAKRYKYLRRIFHFRHMDFEFAIWQMLYLFTSPQKVYRNFQYRKQTKDQWARDDPAFLVLLSIWLCVSTIMFGLVLHMGFFEMLKLLLWIVFIDCVGVGLLFATLMWFISNKYMIKHQGRDCDVEWGYAMDVHLNAFYPLLVILHFIQLFFIKVVISDYFIGYLVGNTFWLIAIGPVYITQEVFSSTINGLEERLMAVITSSLSGRKRTRPSSVSQNPQAEELWDKGEESLSEDRDGTDDSSSEESGGEGPSSASQEEKVLVQILAGLVRSTFKLPISESVKEPSSSLGSLKPPQTAHALPVHNLLEKLLYSEWDHPHKCFLPPKKFSTLYPMEEKFIKMWGIPAIDAAISSMLREPVDKKMESLLKDVFSLAGLVAQPAVAAIGVCQYLRDHVKQVIKVLPEQQAQGLANLPAALCFVVDAIRDSIMQTSRLSLGLVHLRRILWLKNWSAEAPCKKLLAGFPFRGARLFGEDLDNYIKRISCGKSTLLPVKKKSKRPSFKRTLSPAPGASASRQSKREDFKDLH
ncbi:hypothetical protein AB205_0015730 [Aquarana catesbeiana]|uniref:Uncharacterized protein n=1 Tax=Aquarana catesbeiana TaxID=8400 RepID=A0A2G9S8L8_AQUCT|nr:hypothetical protein AB205_0015730 [Aquarana catesbeiana]